MKAFNALFCSLFCKFYIRLATVVSRHPIYSRSIVSNLAKSVLVDSSTNVREIAREKL